MRVADYMSETILYADPDDGARSAFDTMQKSNVHHLPVLDDTGAVRGIVSDRDLRRPRWADADEAAGEAYHLDDGLTVADVMTGHAVSIRPDQPLSDAAKLFVEHRFGALPVLDDTGALVGILSPIDIVWAFLDTVGGR